ncbi:DUF5680 domain-containing protein [Chloroflexota bacterium]
MELAQFLVKAKLNTYAGEGEGGEADLPDGCKELNYREGAYCYRDRYFGFDPFIGQEIVWHDGRPVWAMNYIGMVGDKSAPAGKIYHFLQKALRKVEPARPFRGPYHYQSGDFEYFDEHQGDLSFFKGAEWITIKKQEVYRLEYHGGKMK